MLFVRLFDMVNSYLDHIGSESKLNHKNVVFYKDCWMKPK